MVLKFAVCFAILAVSTWSVEAIKKEDVHSIYEKILPHITACSTEHGLADGELKQAKEEGNVKDINSCFFACVMKKSEIMNDQGLFDTEKTLEKSKEFLKEEEDIEKAAALVEECSSVNSEDVSDSEAGCDRAKLLVACMAKHKDEFWSL